MLHIFPDHILQQMLGKYKFKDFLATNNIYLLSLLREVKGGKIFEKGI